MKATIEFLDEINATVTGLYDNHIDELSDMFAVFAKGFRHRAKYKLGLWDGKIRYFHRTGNTYVKLLPEIFEYLKNNDYEVEIIDHRERVDIDIPAIDKNYLKDMGYDIELGAHQVRGINALTEKNSGIFEGGTGAGKTIMTAILCHLYEQYAGFKCIIIVPTSDLIDQTYDELKEYGVDVGQYGGTLKDTNHVHLVSTWQSLKNNKTLITQYKTVIVDECHGVSGEILRTILHEYGSGSFVKIGLTATIPEEAIDAMAVRITLGHVIERVEASELMASGWLAKLKLYCYELEESVRDEYHEFCKLNPKEAATLDYSAFKRTFFADYQEEKKYIQRKPERLKFLSRLIKTPDKNTLILVPNVEFGRKLAKMIPDSIFFYGKDSKKVRKELYASFADNDDITAITTYSLASTGLNIKRIFYLFLIDAGKSYIQVVQSIGRGLRKAPDKDVVYVYDVHSDFKYCKIHASKRKKHYEKKNYKYSVKKIDYINI